MFTIWELLDTANRFGLPEITQVSFPVYGTQRLNALNRKDKSQRNNLYGRDDYGPKLPWLGGVSSAPDLMAEAQN